MDKKQPCDPIPIKCGLITDVPFGTDHNVKWKGTLKDSCFNKSIIPTVNIF